MLSSLQPIAHLLVSIALLEAGSGLQGVLLPMRAQIEGFSIDLIGLLGTAYYGGFVLGCRAIPAVMRRIGHIRAFSGWAALAAAAFLVHALVVTVPVWLLLRAVAGFCFAGLYIAVESWLNDRATTQTRGQVLATYTVTTWVAVIAGKLLFSATDPSAFLPFATVSILICLAVIPIAFTFHPAPSLAQEARYPIRELLRLSPVGLLGCLGVGAANGAFWSLAPVYAGASGLSVVQVGLFVSAAVAGGALMQWPVGRLSDRVDRRLVIAVCSALAAAAAGALVLEDGIDEAGRLLLAFGFGACALPIYAVCSAHANDRVPSESFVEVSGQLLMMFGIGAMIGPYAAALAMSAVGHAGLFAFTGAAHLLLAAFALVQMRRRAAVAAADKPAFAIEPSAQAAAPSGPRLATQPDDTSKIT